MLEEMYMKIKINKEEIIGTRTGSGSFEKWYLK